MDFGRHAWSFLSLLRVHWPVDQTLEKSSDHNLNHLSLPFQLCDHKAVRSVSLFILAIQHLLASLLQLGNHICQHSTVICGLGLWRDGTSGRHYSPRPVVRLGWLMSFALERFGQHICVPSIVLKFSLLVGHSYLENLQIFQSYSGMRTKQFGRWLHDFVATQKLLQPKAVYLSTAHITEPDKYNDVLGI